MRAQKQRRSAESRRRVSLSLQQLHWLRGYPCPGEAGASWRTLRGEAVVIDGALLSRSRRAARTAMREHPDELAELVGEVERWWSVVDRTLAWCSERRGELDLLDCAPPRTARLARELWRARPELRAVVVAAGVAWALEPAQLTRALAWLAAHPDVAELALPAALSLLHLALVHPAGAAALHQLLLLDAPHPIASVEAIEHLSGWIREQQGNRKRRQGPRDPEAFARQEAARLAKGSRAPAVPRSRPAVLAWFGSLLLLEPAAQRRALSLLALVELPAAARSWIEWEAAHASRLARAREFAERGFDLREEGAHYERIREGLAAAAKAAPARIWIPEVLTCLTTLADKPHSARFVPSILALLEAQPLALAPLGPSWRAHVLCHLTRTASGTQHARLSWLWDDLAEALAAGAPLAVLGPWRQSLANQWSWFDEDMVEAPCKRGDVRDAVRALVALAGRGEVSIHDASALRDWMRAGLSEPLAIECVELGRDVTWPRPPSVELRSAAIALVGPAPAALLAVLRQASDLLRGRSYFEGQNLASLFTRAVAAGLSWLMLAALATGQGEVLLTISSALVNLPRGWWPALGVESFPSPGPSPGAGPRAEGAGSTHPAWLARYPEPLRPALQRLASVDAEAEATAQRRVSAVIADPDELHLEISALRARAPLAPRLAARLANLEARLASPPVPSPSRLARLADKLAQAAASIGLARLEALTHAEATARVLRAFGLEAWPASWPSDRKTVYAVQSLQGLDAPDRQLAARLLHARTGPAPWDLRDEPANRRFLDDLRRRGLDVSPWLDDAPSVVQVGGALELSLCSDPLQVFQMGAHFETCLSPGGINFFSVVANAADVNKRVLYARRAGRVVGRCLLALTDDARLLVFHPYCHEAIDFAEVVHTFTRALAERMGTAVAASGSVRRLLSNDWYDDGAHDLVGRFSALRDAAQLPIDTIEPSAFPARLRELLGRPLDDLSLPTVLELAGLRRRPELVLALSPDLLALSVPATRVAAAVLAMQVGARELAELLLADHGASVHPSDSSLGTSELLARLRPSLLLARLRETRYRGVRSWRDELPHRLCFGGLALEELKRPRQAAALYRLALAKGRSEVSDFITARLRALGASAPDGELDA